MSSIAIITARGGSKRIPQKNIKLFCGKPIIQYSISAALESGVFDTVMVSTDDAEIAKIAIEYGASVPFYRSKKNSDDFATTSDVLVEVLQELEKHGEKFENACCIYPTAPFVTAEKLKEAMALLKDGEADSVLPIVIFDFVPQRALVQAESGAVKYMWPENERLRSQDLPRMYHDSGQFYCFNVSSFMSAKSLIMKKTLGYIINPFEAQDIDTIEDWCLAEMKYKMIMDKG